MYRFYTISCLVLFMVSVGLSQPITSNSFEQKLAAAKEAEAQGNYAGAEDWYQEVYDELREAQGRTSDPKVKEYSLKIAELKYLLRDYEKAEKSFRKILDRDDDNLFTDHRYYYALTLKANAKYSLAIEEFNKLISLSENEDLIKEAEFEIEGIMLLEGIEPNIETAIQPLDKTINSPSAEYSPREAADGNLYYGSLNRKTEINVGSDEDDEYHAKIYMATKDKDGKFDKPEALDQNINRIGFHNTHLAFSKDGRTMYFTRVQTEGTEITSSQILVSRKTDTGWSAANIAPTINGDWYSKHPAVGQLFGRDVLFFVADMDGGMGDYDIYYSNINGDGSLSAPVNLGENINTPKEDLCPFYSDGTLYFSTNGRPTIGGFDIYYSTWNGSEWSKAVNMGLGYNSSYDDLWPFVAPEGGRGMFVSNRPTEDKKKLKSETCCDDIFEFQIREIVIDLLTIVVDEQDAPIDGATVKLVNESDPINYPTDMKYNSLGNEFQFLLDADFKYKATITREGYYPDSIEFNTAGLLDNFTIKKKVTLRPVPVETEVVTINEPIRLNNIYYDFDDDKILKDSEEDLEFLLELMDEYPDLVIELSSHTDAQGAARYNEELSQRRANSAKKWLEQNGVDKNRIKPVGYGEKVILNKCKNRVPCTDEEHRYNRRTEFKIIAGPQTIEIKRPVKSNSEG